MRLQKALSNSLISGNGIDHLATLSTLGPTLLFVVPRSRKDPSAVDSSKNALDVEIAVQILAE